MKINVKITTGGFMNAKKFNRLLDKAMKEKGNLRFYYLADLILLLHDNSELARLLYSQIIYLTDKCENNKTEVNTKWLPIRAGLEYIIKHQHLVDDELIKKYNS